MLKFNLDEIPKGTYKSEELKSALKNIKLLYELRGAVVKLFNDYSLIMSEAKYKTKYGKFHKLLTLKQMLQRLPIALTQSVTHLKICLMKVGKLYIFCTKQNKLLKKYTTV